MTGRGPETLAIACLALAAGAAAVVVSGSPRPAAQAERSRAFQETVHGLGFGPTLDLSRCERDFDPRVGNVCPGRHEVIPAGDRFCPHHPCSILFP